MKTIKLEIKVSEKTHKEFKNYCKINGILTSRGYTELLEMALMKEIIGKKCIEPFDFFSKENTSKIVDVVIGEILKNNEFIEIIKSKFDEAKNNKKTKSN